MWFVAAQTFNHNLTTPACIQVSLPDVWPPDCCCVFSEVKRVKYMRVTCLTCVFQMKPEMERYEWVIIKHPELASAAQPAGNEQTGGEDNGAPLSLEKPATESSQLSPFLSARHFNLNSRNTSMFMAGNVDSIIIGKWDTNFSPIRFVLLLLFSSLEIKYQFLQEYNDRCISIHIQYRFIEYFMM